MKKVLSLVFIVCIFSMLFTGCGKKEEVENIPQEIPETMQEPTAEEKLQDGKFNSYAKMDLETAEKFMEVLKQLESKNKSDYIVRFYDLGNNNEGFPMLVTADLNAEQTNDYKAFELWLYDGEEVNSFDYLKDTQASIRDLTIDNDSIIFRIGNTNIERKKETAGYIEYKVNDGKINVENKFFHYVFNKPLTASSMGKPLSGTVLPDDKEYTLTADENSPYNPKKYIDTDDVSIYYTDSNPNGTWMRGEQNPNDVGNIWASTYWHLLKENDTIYKFDTMEEFAEKSKELFDYYENTKYAKKGNLLFVIDSGKVKHSGTAQDVTLPTAIDNLQEYIDLLKEVNNG